MVYYFLNLLSFNSQSKWSNCINGAPHTRSELPNSVDDKANEPVNADGKSRDHLATGADLERFGKLEQKHNDWLSPTELAYVTASKDARQREELQRIRLFRGVVAASVLFALAAVIAGLFYLSATKQTQIAEKEKLNADMQAATAIANESRALTGLSRVAFEDGRSRAISAGKLYTHEWQLNGPVRGVLMTKDETRILSWSDDNTLHLWNVATGQQIGPTINHDDTVTGALLTKNDTRILSWSIDHTLRLWDVATGQQIGPAMKHDGPVTGALLTKNATRILSWSSDDTLRLWDVATGQQIGPAMTAGRVRGALLMKDETRILSWS